VKDGEGKLVARASSTCMKLRQDHPLTTEHPAHYAEGRSDGESTALEPAGQFGRPDRGRPGWCPCRRRVRGAAPRRESDERLSFRGGPRSAGNRQVVRGGC